MPNPDTTLSSRDAKIHFRKYLLNHVQYYMPFAPQMGASLRHPLRYLRMASSLEEELTDNEKDMADAVVPFVGTGSTPSKLVSDIKSRVEQIVEGETPESMVITGNPGSGKTIYSGMVFAELCEEFESTDDRTLLMYSQLKDTDAPRGSNNPVWERILEGIKFDDFNVKNDIFDFRKNSIPDSVEVTILMIDSLDEIGSSKEVDIAERIEKTTKLLIDQKIFPIWFCRDRFYETKGLSRLESDNLIERIRIPLLKPPEKDKFEVEGDIERTRWLALCFSTLPLLYSFTTNFAISEKDEREEMEHKLLGEMKRLHSELNESDLTKQNPRHLVPPRIWNQLASDEEIPVLTDILSRFMLESLQERLEPDLYERCEQFLKLVAQRMMETIHLRGFDIDEWAPGKVTEQEGEQFDDVISLLKYIGFLSSSKGDWRGTKKLRFSHRAFAEYTIWNYTKDIEKTRKQLVDGSVSFSWRGSLLGDGITSEEIVDLETLMIYTGAFLSFIPPLSGKHLEDANKNYKQPWLEAYNRRTRTNILLNFQDGGEDDSDSEVEGGLLDGVSRLQYEAIKHYVDEEKPIQIQGYPGTGKTYTGVEVVLRKIANDKSSNALILTLNEALSHDIKQDLLHKHGKSKELREVESSVIIDRITPLSVREILNIWTPDIDTEKLITENDLKIRFKENSKSGEMALFRFAFADFHHTMFDYYGEIIDLKDYLKETKLLRPEAGKFANEKERDELARMWHKDIKALTKSKLPLHKACMILINRIRLWEGSWGIEGDRITEGDYAKILSKIYWSSRAKEMSTKSPKDKDVAVKRVQNILSKLSTQISHHSDDSVWTTQFPRLFDMALVDEVQDLPPQAVVLASFLTKDRSNPHDLIFVGDHAQALNFEDFNWERFFGQSKKLAEQLVKEIPERHKQTYARHLNEIIGLYTDKDDIFSLKENHRNPKEIINSMVAATWWKPNGFDGEVPTTSVSEITNMKVKNKETGSVSVIDSKTISEYEENLKQLFEEASQNAQISIVVCDDLLKDIISNQMDTGKFHEYKTEFFDAWTIKGLERPKVAILGGWMVSKGGSDNLVWDANKNRPDRPRIEEEGQVDRINRKMLVALSRAQEGSLILIPPTGSLNPGQKAPTKRMVSGAEFYDSIFSTEGRNFIQLDIPLDLETGEQSTLNDFFEGRSSGVGSRLKFTRGLFALSEGIEYSKKAKYSGDLKKNLELNMNRVSNIISSEISAQKEDSSNNDEYLLTKLIEELDGVESLQDSTLLLCISEYIYDGPMNEEMASLIRRKDKVGRFGDIYEQAKENKIEKFDSKGNKDLMGILDFVKFQEHMAKATKKLQKGVFFNYDLQESGSFEGYDLIQQKRLKTAQRVIHECAMESIEHLSQIPSNEFGSRFDGLVLMLGHLDVDPIDVDKYKMSESDKKSINDLFLILRVNSRQFRNGLTKNKNLKVGGKDLTSEFVRRLENLMNILTSVIELIPSRGGRKKSNRSRLYGIKIDFIHEFLENIQFCLDWEDERTGRREISLDLQQRVREIRLLFCLPEFAQGYTGPGAGSNRDPDLEQQRKIVLPDRFVEYIFNQRSGGAVNGRRGTWADETKKRLKRIVAEIKEDSDLFQDLLEPARSVRLHQGLRKSPLEIRLEMAEIAIDYLSEFGEEGGKELAGEIALGLIAELMRAIMNREYAREEKGLGGEFLAYNWVIDFEDSDEWNYSKEIIDLTESFSKYLKIGNVDLEWDGVRAVNRLEGEVQFIRLYIYASLLGRGKDIPHEYSKGVIQNTNKSINDYTSKMIWELIITEVESLNKPVGQDTDESGLEFKNVAKLFNVLQTVPILSTLPLTVSGEKKLHSKAVDTFYWLSTIYPHLPHPGKAKDGKKVMKHISGDALENWENISFDRLQDFLVLNIKNNQMQTLNPFDQPKFFNNSLRGFWDKESSSFGFLRIDNATEYKIIRSFQNPIEDKNRKTIAKNELAFVDAVGAIANIALWEVNDALENGQDEISLARIYRKIVMTYPYFQRFTTGKTKGKRDAELSRINALMKRKGETISLFPKSVFDGIPGDGFYEVRNQRWNEYERGFIVNIIESMGFEISDGKIELVDDSGEFLLQETPAMYLNKMLTGFACFLVRTKTGKIEIRNGLFTERKRFLSRKEELVPEEDQLLGPIGSYSTMLKEMEKDWTDVPGVNLQDSLDRLNEEQFGDG